MTINPEDNYTKTQITLLSLKNYSFSFISLPTLCHFEGFTSYLVELVDIEGRSHVQEL